jgi:hypothetical protein
MALFSSNQPKLMHMHQKKSKKIVLVDKIKLLASNKLWAWDP